MTGKLSTVLCSLRQKRMKTERRRGERKISMDEHKDICRSFSFVNLNIPPHMKNVSDEKDRFHCGYISVGFFDGMRTELLPTYKDGSILPSMWLQNERLALALDGTHSFQNIFGFRYDDKKQKDEKFWSDETDCRYPLTFVTFLQMQPEKGGKRTPIREQLRAIEESLANEAEKEENRYIFACYVTLDKNDFVICIKSKQYRGIANSILALHNSLKPKILYSYSVLSLNRRWMNQLAEDESIFPVDGMEDELIDSICLKGITNSVTAGSLSDKYGDLCGRLDRFLFMDEKQDEHDSQLYDILGDYDFRYIARKVPMKRLLLAIAEKEGPLNYESSLFRFALFSSNFVLNIQSRGVPTGAVDHRDHEALGGAQNIFDYPIVFEESELSDGVNALERNLVNPLCGRLMDKFEELRHRLDEELHRPLDRFSLENTTYWTNMVSLWKLLSSLSALEKAPTRKYDFHSLYWSYRMLITILDRIGYHKDRKMPDGDLNDLYGFIHGLSATIHGTLRTDIQFFQVNDFNAIVHYAPAKLRAFYSAWTYELTQCYRQIHSPKLREQDGEYEFIIVPNTNVVIRTFAFNPDSRKHDAVGRMRLMRIEIPERYLYQPRETCIHLAHETAHFVGTSIRCRSVRHRQFTAILAGMVTSQYCTDICNCLVKSGRKEMAKLFQRFVLEEQRALCRDIRRLLREAIDQVSEADGRNNIWKDEHILSNTFISYITTALQMVLDRPAYAVEDFHEGRRSERSKVAYRVRDLCSDFRFYARDHWEGDLEELEAGLMDFVRISDDLSSGQYSRNFAQFLRQTGSSSILQMLMLLIKEAQADITSILTLQITPLQYFQSFFESGLTYGDESLGIILKFRLFYVLSALQKASKRPQLRFLKEKGWDRPFSGSRGGGTQGEMIGWIEEKLKDVSDQLSPSLCANVGVLPVRAEPFAQPDEESVRSSTCGYFVLYSEFAAKWILVYLRECIHAMQPEFCGAEGEEKTGLRRMSKIYSKICSKDAIELAEEIDKMLFEYEKKRSRQP